MRERSMTRPTSTAQWPAGLWPPPRTAISRPRAWPKASAAATSSTSMQRAITAGRRSISRLKQRRARSYSRSPSTSTSPVSESRNSSTARASLRAPIHHGHRPRLIGGCTDECELGARGKQWLPSPKRSRTHIEAVLVYEVVLDERLRGTNAPVEQQILPRLVLELGEPLNEIAIAGNEELL